MDSLRDMKVQHSAAELNLEYLKLNYLFITDEQEKVTEQFENGANQDSYMDSMDRMSQLIHCIILYFVMQQNKWQGFRQLLCILLTELIMLARCP